MVPFGDVAACDHAEPRDPEELPHLRLADRLLDLLRREHADERLLDVLGQLVDDAVRPDVDALAIGQAARLGVRADVEADDDRARRGREHHVALGDRADPRVDDVDAYLRVLDLRELALDRLERALDVALHDDVQVLDDSLSDPREEVLERRAALRLLGELLGAQPLAAQAGEVARLPIVLDDARVLARLRRLVEAEDLDRRARASPA